MPEPTIAPDPERPVEPNDASRREPVDDHDKVPGFMLRSQAWLHRWLSNESRLVLGLVIVGLAVLALIVLSTFRFLHVIFEGLDVIAYVGLFLVNWLGNGGILVPIPGARFIGLLMIFQQAVLMPSWEVFVVAGAAMSLGLLSYYIAGARTAQSLDAGDEEGAEQLAEETGMLDEDAGDFAPGAELDAQAVGAIAGVQMPAAEPEPDDGDKRFGRLRRRFTTSLRQAQRRAEPVIDQRGTMGMLLLCFAPTPMGTAAAYVGGVIHFGFRRFLLASFSAKFLLAGIIVMLALVFNDSARSVQIPDVELPDLGITLFDGSAPSPSPSPSAAPSGLLRFPDRTSE